VIGELRVFERVLEAFVEVAEGGRFGLFVRQLPEKVRSMFATPANRCDNFVERVRPCFFRKASAASSDSLDFTAPLT